MERTNILFFSFEEIFLNYFLFTGFLREESINHPPISVTNISLKSLFSLIHKIFLFIHGMPGTHCVLPKHLGFPCAIIMLLGFCSNMFTSVNSHFSSLSYRYIHGYILHIESCFKLIQKIASTSIFSIVLTHHSKNNKK